MLHIIEVSILVSILLCAAIMDIKTDRVPNLLIIVGFGFTLGFRLLSFDVTRISDYFAGALIPSAAFFIFFIFRMFGAGDIKLLSLTGAVLGLKAVMNITVIALFVGAIFSVVRIILNRNLIIRMHYLADYFLGFIRDREIGPYYVKEEGNGNMVHFAVCILLGLSIYGGCLFGQVNIGIM